MVNRLMSKTGLLLAYFCVATILTQMIGVGYLVSTGRLDDEMTFQLRAVLQGINLAASSGGSTSALNQASAEPLSYADKLIQSDNQTLNMELRIQSIISQLALIQAERNKLTDQADHLRRLKLNFEEELEKRIAGATSRGLEEERRTFATMKPKQAKEMLRLRLEHVDGLNHVVDLFANLPIATRAKIVAEFKTPDELKQLDEILRRIARGGEEAVLFEETKRQIGKGGTAAPSAAP
jgi:hypothetical protein